jgi:hypothetical protein
MKYRIWENSQYTETNTLPKDMPVVGVSGFSPTTNLQHFLAAGYNPDSLLEEEKNKPAHFNQPFAEIIS